MPDATRSSTTRLLYRAARFLDDVEVERIVLYALAAPTSVTSFRTATLAPWVARELEAMRLAAEDAKLRAAAAEAEGEEDLISSTPVHGDTLCGTAGKVRCGATPPVPALATLSA